MRRNLDENHEEQEEVEQHCEEEKGETPSEKTVRGTWRRICSRRAIRKRTRQTK